VKKANEAAGLHFNIKKTKLHTGEEDTEVMHSYIFLGFNMDRKAG